MIIKTKQHSDQEWPIPYRVVRVMQAACLHWGWPTVDCQTAQIASTLPCGKAHSQLSTAVHSLQAAQLCTVPGAGLHKRQNQAQVDAIMVVCQQYLHFNSGTTQTARRLVNRRSCRTPCCRPPSTTCACGSCMKKVTQLQCCSCNASLPWPNSRLLKICDKAVPPTLDM